MNSLIALVTIDDQYAKKYQQLFAKHGWELWLISPSEFKPQTFHEIRPDLFLVEIVGEGQIDVVKAIRCRDHLRKIPIIALIGNTPKELVLSAHQVGIHDILAKQSEKQQIIERIQKYCPSTPPAANGKSLLKAEDELALEWSDPATTAYKKHVQREVLQRLEMIPSLPLVVMEIMKLVDNEKSSASDFEEHISHDQALTARILRIANSSFFVQSRKIKSIRDAIVILGYRTLKSVVMAASTGGILNRPAGGYGLIAGGLWKHSIACAVGSRLLAVKLGHKDAEAEEFFIYGLLHDIGKLLLNQFIEEKSANFHKAFTEQGLDLLEAEMMTIGTHHSLIGEKIAERWNLPQEVRTIIQHHHQPSQAKQFKDQVTLVHCVNHLCHQLNIGMDPENVFNIKFDQAAAEKIGATEEFLESLQEEFIEKLEELEKLFAVIGGES